MELSVLALQAVNIALFATDKIAGGALEKIGAEILDLLRRRFHGRLTLEEAVREPKLLEAAIISESEHDKTFQRELEQLVSHYHQVQNSFNMSGSGVQVNVTTNTGKVTGQEINNFFR
jgi:hypothetical protein